MSETVSHKVKIKNVEFVGTLNDLCQQLCELNGIEASVPLDTDWVKELKDSLYEKYFIVEDEVWEILENEDLDPYSTLEILNEEKDELTVLTTFHNGGTCLSEQLEDLVIQHNESNRLEYTARGFPIYGKLKDTKSSLVRVQKSSAADTEAVWIFCDSYNEDKYPEADPHLNKDQAKELIKYLQRFIDGEG